MTQNEMQNVCQQVTLGVDFLCFKLSDKILFGMYVVN